VKRKIKRIVCRLGSNEPVRLSELKPGESIKIIEEERASTTFTVYRPPRKRTESPVQYYRRTKGVVDDCYAHIHKGRYYCNPAHCSRSWKNKETRDEHLDMAYALLA